MRAGPLRHAQDGAFDKLTTAPVQAHTKCSLRQAEGAQFAAYRTALVD